jgi:exosortase/archaeosortase family protein
MTPAARRTVVRLLVVFGVAGVVFVFAISTVRGLETRAAGALLQLVAGDRVQVQLGTSLQVFPSGHLPFRATLTPACSALASMLTVLALGLLLPSPSRQRRVWSCLAAVAVVVGCNIARVAASVGVGLVLGRVSLVMFHDWIGSAFTFAYTLGGLLVLLHLRLPAERRPT